MSPRRGHKPLEVPDENDLPDMAVFAMWDRVEPVGDGWPCQVAPQVWVDQDGRRYTDLGEAQAGAQEIRGR